MTCPICHYRAEPAYVVIVCQVEQGQLHKLPVECCTSCEADRARFNAVSCASCGRIVPDGGFWSSRTPDGEWLCYHCQ